jgi:quinol monooxygenase YgiN
MRFAQEDREKVAEMLRKLAEASRKEPGCRNYVPHTIEGDPETVVIYEQYESRDAVEAHRNSPHFQEFAVGGIYQLLRERAVENLTALI